jgi:threonine/homoserine/homoserine lactone efflux protein
MPRVSAQARVARRRRQGAGRPRRTRRKRAGYAALVFLAIALYTLAAALLTVVGGPDNALLLRNALRGGRSSALASAVGCASGLVCWGLVAAVGLTALASAGRVGDNLLRVAAAVSLVGLGLRLRPSADAKTPVAACRHRGGGQPRRLAPGAAHRPARSQGGGVLVSFLPQFIPAGGNVLAMTVLYGSSRRC